MDAQKTNSQKRKKISHLCKVFFPTKGGIQTVVHRWCDATFENYDNAIICTGKPERDLKYKQANIYRKKAFFHLNSLPLSISIFPAIWSAIKSDDVLIIHYPFPLAEIALLFSQKPVKTKIIVYWHANIHSQKLSKIFLSPLTFLMLRKAEKILIASPPTMLESKILRHFKNKIELLTYGEPDISTDLNPTKNLHNKPYFLAIGRHVTYKGFESLIEAMKFNDYHLVIIGDGPLLKKNIDLASRLNLSERIEFVQTNDSNIKENYLAKCHALILPSIYPSEAFALVQIEAMKHGKPIINTNLKSGVPWVARHKKEAITVETNNPLELSNSMTILIKDESLVKRLSIGARKRFVEKFDIRHFENKLNNLLKRWIA